MRIIIKPDLFVIVPESNDDLVLLGAWKDQHRAHHLLVVDDPGEGVALKDLGDPVLTEPINVTSQHPEPAIKLISNLAETPFVLDGRRYQSVEGFWQGLKFTSDDDRRRLASMSKSGAITAGRKQPYGAFVEYQGQRVRVGAFDHWELMRRACAAKFEQHKAAREALLGTCPRPLIHQPKRDSTTIPGHVMAGIWLAIRENLSESAGAQPEAAGEMPLSLG